MTFPFLRVLCVLSGGEFGSHDRRRNRDIGVALLLGGFQIEIADGDGVWSLAFEIVERQARVDRRRRRFWSTKRGRGRVQRRRRQRGKRERERLSKLERSGKPCRRLFRQRTREHRWPTSTICLRLPDDRSWRVSCPSGGLTRHTGRLDVLCSRSLSSVRLSALRSRIEGFDPWAKKSQPSDFGLHFLVC